MSEEVNKAQGLRGVLVYVAGPITSGDLVANVSRAHEAGLALVRAGLSAFVPHSRTVWGNCLLSAGSFAGFVPSAEFPGASYDDWLSLGLVFVQRSDCLLRLEGESAGADRQEQHARACGLPVFSTVEQAVAWAAKKKKKKKKKKKVGDSKGDGGRQP